MQSMKNLFLRNPSRAYAAVAILVAILALPVLSSVAYGQTGGALQPAPTTNITTVDGVLGLVKTGFNILFWFLVVLAAIFLIMAAFAYLTAGGEPEAIKKANHRVIYAAVAVVVAVFARAIPAIVCNFLGANGTCTF